MRGRNILKRLPHFLIALWFIQAPGGYAQPNVTGQYRITRIYIESYPNVKEGVKIDPSLKAELGKCGFEVVDDASKADAILSGGIQGVEIVLHGDGSIPDKAIYHYQLASPGGEIVLKGRIKFVSKQSVAEDNKYAARKIAEKVAKKVGAK